MKLAALLLAAMAWGQVGTNTTLATHPANAFMMSSFNAFTGSFTPSGTGALNISLSPDGINWSAPVYQFDTTNCNGPGPGISVGYCARDPHIGKFGNNGWIPYTCAGQSGANALAQFCITKIDLAACYASISTCTFQAVQYISTAAFSATLLSWSPTWVKNADNTIYKDAVTGCPSIIYSPTDGDGGVVFEVAEMHPTGTCTNSTDFAAATWTTPVVLTHMDTNMLAGEVTYDGTAYTMFYTNNTNPNQSVQYGTSATLTGTYTKQSSGVNWTGFQNGGFLNQEGPSIFCLSYSGTFPSGSCTRWRMYFDQVPAAVGNIVLGQINYSESASFAGPWTEAIPINTSTQAKNANVIPYP